MGGRIFNSERGEEGISKGYKRGTAPLFEGNRFGENAGKTAAKPHLFNGGKKGLPWSSQTGRKKGRASFKKPHLTQGFRCPSLEKGRGAPKSGRQESGKRRGAWQAEKSHEKGRNRKQICLTKKEKGCHKKNHHSGVKDDLGAALPEGSSEKKVRGKKIPLEPNHSEFHPQGCLNGAVKSEKRGLLEKKGEDNVLSGRIDGKDTWMKKKTKKNHLNHHHFGKEGVVIAAAALRKKQKFKEKPLH